MSGFPLFLLTPVLIAAFLWRRRITLRASFLFWGAGVLLQRVVPMFIPGSRNLNLQAPPSFPPIAVEIVVWLGTICLGIGLASLVTYERPRRRREIVWAALLGIFLIVGGLSHSTIPGLAFIAIPAIWSFRWRARLGALQLLLANLGALLSLLLLTISFNFGLDPDSARLAGLARFGLEVQVLGILYSLFSIPAAASRAHLSIRSIGRRLVGSHLLAATIPFVLAAIFLMLSGTLYLANYRGVLGSRYLANISEEARSRMVEVLGRVAEVDRLPFGGEAAGQILLIREGDEPVNRRGAEPRFDPSLLLAEDRSSRRAPLLWDGGTLFVRARLDTVRDGRPLRIEALAPVDSVRMSTISSIAGVPIRIHPSVSVTRSGGGVQLGGIGPDSAGTTVGPSAAKSRDLPGGAIVSCLRMEDGAWDETAILVSSSASFGETLLSLIPSARENPLGTIVLIVLAVIAFFFLTAIWITVGMVYSMGSSITQAVRALTRATSAVGAGRLDHRIAIGGQDDLWRVAESFNEMTEGLEKMRAMEREAQRLDEELRLAREIQDRLLPAAPPAMERLELAGLSLPAREIGGDYFDYIPLEEGLVGLAVADVSGKGAPAALLMSTFRASLRSQDLTGLGPGEVLARLNRFIHSSVDPGKFITAFVGLLDPATGIIRYANAGHDPPILVLPDGGVRELTGGGLILGMLPQIVYEEAVAEIPPGSILAVFTDGVTEARNEAGEFYGTDRLVEVMRESGGEPCVDLLQKIVDSIQRYAGEASQSDDITIILARRR